MKIILRMVSPQRGDIMKCNCDAPDHEMCWDGLVGLYDPNCSCCRDTEDGRYLARELE